MLAEGQRYLYGQGVRKSCEQALNLIHGAANEGNAEARSQLGGMYATGNCAPFDRVTAYRWFTLALSASPRNPRVQQTRDMLWREMTDTERQRARNMTESRD
jgi:TPR repeat protein